MLGVILFIHNKVQSLQTDQDILNTAMTYEHSGQYDDAINILQKRISLYPNNASLNCSLGFVYAKKWYSAEQANPNTSNILLKDAEQYLETGIQLDPQSASCQGNYAVAIYDDNSKDLNLVWPQVKKAQSLGWVFDQQFLTNLQAVSPEPK